MYPKVVFIFFVLISFSLADRTIFMVQKGVVKKIVLPFSKGDSYILETESFLNVSFTSCTSSGISIPFFNATGQTSVFLPASQIEKVERDSHCVTENLLDLDVISPIDGSFNINQQLITFKEFSNESAEVLKVPTTQKFELFDFNYLNLKFLLPAIDGGVSIEIFPSYTSDIEVFATFCLETEGKLLGNMKFPHKFKVDITENDLVDLIDKSSCDGSLFSVFSVPPPMIIRLRSLRSEGIISVKQNDISRKARSNSLIAINSSESFLVPLDTYDIDFTFEVHNGTSTVEIVSCGVDEITPLGDFPAGLHRIVRKENSDLFVNCTDEFEIYPSIRFRSVDSAYISLLVTPPKVQLVKPSLLKFFSILVVSASILFCLMLFSGCLLRKCSRQQIHNDDEPSRKTVIPMHVSWISTN